MIRAAGGLTCARDAARSAGLRIPAFERIDPQNGINNAKVRHHVERHGWRILPVGVFALPDAPVPALINYYRDRRGHLVYIQDLGAWSAIAPVAWIAIRRETPVRRTA